MCSYVLPYPPSFISGESQVKFIHDGPGIGGIGMCLTGTLPLALLGNSNVMAPVVCQPGLPLSSPQFPFLQSDLGLTQMELCRAKTRIVAENLKIFGFSFLK